jgi:hypothetical protein
LAFSWKRSAVQTFKSRKRICRSDAVIPGIRVLGPIVETVILRSSAGMQQEKRIAALEERPKRIGAFASRVQALEKMAVGVPPLEEHYKCLNHGVSSVGS